MTQPVAAPPPPAVQQAPAPAAPAKRRGFWPAPTGKPVGAGVEDTPSLLNRLQIIGMAVVLVFGLLSGLVQFLSYQSDGRAADDTEQLVRVQEIQSSLLRVDAVATNLALVGRDGDPEIANDRAAAYDKALASVFEQIAAAADAQPADEEALAALNVRVNDYATAIAAGRANLRLGYPVGKEYLSGASAALRTDALPILANLVDANTERAEDSMAGQHPFWLLLIGVAAAAALVWVNLMLARRFRRYVNAGVAVAAVIVLVVTLVAAVAAWRGDSQNDDLLSNELKQAVDHAAARTAGNDAKANESLLLINRGSGARYEDPWKAAAEIVEEKADRQVLDEWDLYVARHNEIFTFADEDRKGLAVQVAIGEGAEGSTGPFEAFDAAAQAVITENGDATTDDLRAGRTLALIGSLLTLLLGFVAAVAVARGISARRREFA